MKLVPMVALSLAGCSLYFGSNAPPERGDRPDAGRPGDPVDGGRPGDPVDGGRPGRPPDGGPQDGGARDSGSPPPQDAGGGPGSCGAPELHVIAMYETGSDHATTGDAFVAIDRPGNHVLVLSAYESTNWHVRLAAGATVRSVELLGYEAQTVDLRSVPVTHGTACGYSYPYNGGGCDTNQLLALAEAQAGVRLTTFHGCYQASSWTLHADGTATSNCNTAAGYQQDDLLGRCLR